MIFFKIIDLYLKIEQFYEIVILSLNMIKIPTIFNQQCEKTSLYYSEYLLRGKHSFTKIITLISYFLKKLMQIRHFRITKEPDNIHKCL